MKIPVLDAFGSVIGYIVAPVGGLGCLECLVVGIFMFQDPEVALVIGLWLAMAFLPLFALGLLIVSLSVGKWEPFIASLVCGGLWIATFAVYLFMISRTVPK